MNKIHSLFLLVFILISTSISADTLKLATTTSTENSGLLNKIIPIFENNSGHKVHVIAVGTGKALRMGEGGDADVLLVHSRKAEDQFIADGHGVNHRSVMYNDFVIVGPKDDPANIQGERDSSVALKKIFDTQNIFISRGDNSGTHKKERTLWNIAGLNPTGKWYREAGQGMGRVLHITNELSSYTLTDRGTWLSNQSHSKLKVLVEGDERLFNPYGIIAVNPKKYPDIKYTAAMAFITWITSPQAQQHIANYRINNKALFIPMAIKTSQLIKK